MNIGQIVEQLDTFTDDERKLHVGALIDMLSGVSKSDIRQHQEKHFAEHPKHTPEGWQAFVTGLNKVIRRCVMLETSKVIGDPVRVALGLDPITLETEVKYATNQTS